MSFSKHNNYELPEGGVQNWDASLNENFELIEKGPTIKATAGLNIAIDKVVYMNISERLNLAISPTGATTASQFLGFTTTAIDNETDGFVQTLGNHSNPNWSFTPGPVYLDASTAGDITQTEPTSSTLVGYAIGTNELTIRPWISSASDHGALSGLGDDDHTQYLRTDNFRSTSGLTVTGPLSVDEIIPETEGWVSIQAGLTVGDLNIQGVMSGPGSDIAMGSGHMTILPHAYSSITAGSWALLIDSLQIWNGVFYNTTDADADRVNYKVYLTAGTYTFNVTCVTTSLYGILDVSIDGFSTSEGTIDMYSASTVRNVIKTITGITVSNSGLVDLSLKINDKNASSGGYTIGLSSITLFRTV